MGTSLSVNPFASLIDRVANHVPRLLINREKVGVHTHDPKLDSLKQQYQRLQESYDPIDLFMAHMILQKFPEISNKASIRSGFDFGEERNAKDCRDIFLQGDVDTGVEQLISLLGWQLDSTG